MLRMLRAGAILGLLLLAGVVVYLWLGDTGRILDSTVVGVALRDGSKRRLSTLQEWDDLDKDPVVGIERSWTCVWTGDGGLIFGRSYGEAPFPHGDSYDESEFYSDMLLALGHRNERMLMWQIGHFTAPLYSNVPDSSWIGFCLRYRKHQTPVTGYTYLIRVPYGPVLSSTLLAVILLSTKPLRARRGRMVGRCLRCGYDLRASTDRCPECGTPFVRSPGGEKK